MSHRIIVIQGHTIAITGPNTEEVERAIRGAMDRSVAVAQSALLTREKFIGAAMKSAHRIVEKRQSSVVN